MKNIDAYINNFATRCFRNIADRDYISARMCYRAGLISQFHWSSLQAFEKYYKAILLYNRIKAKNIGHNLELAQKKTKQLPFEIKLSEVSEKLLKHLDSFGQFRYLETSYFIHGPKLVELDKAIWEVRRYCRVLDYESNIKGKENKSMLGLELKAIQTAESRPPQTFRIVGGELEKIIDKRTHPAREPLIWQNGFYGKSNRTLVRVPKHFYAENSPINLEPELLENIAY